MEGLQGSGVYKGREREGPYDLSIPKATSCVALLLGTQ